MSRIAISHPEAHEKLTARLFWKLTTETGYVDAGNVREYADATTRSLVTRARAARGARHVNAEQADLNHEAYTFLLDENVPEQDQLIRLARLDTDQSQTATEAATATVTNVGAGRWHDIGAWKIANVSVEGSVSGALEEGTHYELDQENGRIKSIGISGESFLLTFDQPGITFEKRTTQQQPLFYCDIILEEFNQFSKLWLRRLSFRATLNVTEFPNHTGEFATYRVKATPTEPVTVLKRPEAQSLNTAPETPGSPAGDSSSSSSSSSNSSDSSSSTLISYTSSTSGGLTSDSSSSTEETNP